MRVELHENGNKRSESNYKNGKLDGLNLGWYDNGEKSSESNYIDGKKDGPSVTWHDNGEKSSESNWKDNKVVEGSRKYWNNEGDVIPIEIALQQQEAARAKIREQMLKARSSKGSSNNDSIKGVILPPPRS